MEELDVALDLARVSAPLLTTENLQPPNAGDSVRQAHHVSLDCSDWCKAIRYQADSKARCFASMNCLTLSTKTGLSGSPERYSDSCHAWLDSLVVFVTVPTRCLSYCAKQAESEGDQCRAKSRQVTSGATISPRARQSHGVLRMSKFVSVPKSRWPAIHRKWQIRVNFIRTQSYTDRLNSSAVSPRSARQGLRLSSLNSTK